MLDCLILSSLRMCSSWYIHSIMIASSRRSDLPWSQEGASVVLFTHEQNSICRQKLHRRKMSDRSSRDYVTLPNSKWRRYLHSLCIPVERRLIAASDIFRVAWIFFYPFSPIAMGFVSFETRRWPVFGIQLWITNDNNVSEKSRVTRNNGLYSQLNAADK